VPWDDGAARHVKVVGKVILQLDPRCQQTQQALAQFAERREQREGWHARLPTTMAALIEQGAAAGESLEVERAVSHLFARGAGAAGAEVRAEDGGGRGRAGRQGDNGRGLFVLLRGRCVAYDVPTGEEYPELSEGAVLGEISLSREVTKKLERIARERLERSAKLFDHFGITPSLV
jgi:hypothetical protein